jgi:hypothetical protein
LLAVGSGRDIHFWFSAYQDWLDLTLPIGQQIFNIHVSIHEDIPDPDGPGPEYSRPGLLLWQRDFPVDAVAFSRCYTEGQSWYDPAQGFFVPNDHFNLYRCDIRLITDPFIQEVGKIYWLDLAIASELPLGWKTADLDRYPAPWTGNHFQDDGVWGDYPNPFWQELRWPPGVPNGGQSIDLAFVITQCHGVGDDEPQSYPSGRTTRTRSTRRRRFATRSRRTPTWSSRSSASTVSWFACWTAVRNRWVPTPPPGTDVIRPAPRRPVVCTSIGCRPARSPRRARWS